MPNTDSGLPRSGGRLKGYVLALASATAYGLAGTLVGATHRKFGVASETIVFFRTGLTFLVLLIGLAAWRRQDLRISRRDLPLFALLGVVGMAAFYLVFLKAITVAGVAVAEVLLYTGPLWVSLYAWRRMGEPLNLVKALALGGILVGAAFVSGISDYRRLQVNPSAVALGLGAGFLLAVYTILSKIALRRYSPWTVLVYGLAVAWPVVTLPQDLPAVWHALTTPGELLWLAGVAITQGVVAAGLYNAALVHLPASNATIVATWEPVVGVLLAVTLLGERLAPIQVLGGALIIGSIILVASRRQHQDEASPVVDSGLDSRSRAGERPVALSQRPTRAEPDDPA